MAPSKLESETLGQIHRRFNKSVNDTSPSKAWEIAELNYEESDLDNLLNIEIACKFRNVDYILKVFQSEDMLYVSRAIKRSTWLITDTQYSHIINPTFLYENLQPKMIVKGFKKLILNIRLNLKEEICAKVFFNYHKEKDFNTALKWLPLCSVEFAENILYEHGQKIPPCVLHRLCEKSFDCLEKYLSGQSYIDRFTVFNSTKFLLKRNTEAYLKLIESDMNRVPKLGAKHTRLIMNKCPERVFANLEKYCKILHIPTFVIFIKTEEMKDFILANINKEEMRYWFTQNNIVYFIKRLPKENRFEFLKDLFIDKKYKEINDGSIKRCLGYSGYQSSPNTYAWYKYAPFQTAFVDLRKLVRAESKPQERTAMLEILLTCAGKNMNNISTLLKYYRENHINEPLKFKMQFVNEVLSHADTYRFNKVTWGFLNDLFSSMEVYSDDKKMDQMCVRSIILYHVIHDENIPDIIKQKFTFCTFKMFQRKLTGEEKEKVFLYLYKNLTSKIENLDINKESELNEAFKLYKNVLQLLLDSNKVLADFPMILNKIKEIIYINETKKWIIGLEQLLDFKKSWRKLFFPESILLKPTQETCINALKHGPELIEKYKNIVEEMCLNDDRIKIQFLKKLRIYWPQTLAGTYKNLFMNRLEVQKLHKSTILGLCCMLPKRELSDLVVKHAPAEIKIDWTRPNDVDLSIRKNLGKNLSLARPQPSAALALLYAKGDYIQFVLPSLTSILYNTSSIEIRDYIPRLLEAPVSLQKHGIRLIFSKLRYDEIKKLYSDIWKSARNSSIRADIFCQTLNFLCEEKAGDVIKEMWQLLCIFIDNLKHDENKIIYTKMSKVEKVPMVIRPEYWMKTYKFLKSLPPQANCEGLVAHMISNMLDVLHLLDNDFVAEILLESIDEKIFTDRYAFANLLSVCLLSTKTEEVHVDRCKKILIPLLDIALPMWDKGHNGTHYAQFNLQEIFSNIDQQFERVVLDQKMFMPIPLYTEIFERVTAKLPAMENYCTITKRKLALECVKIFDKVCENNEAVKAERSSSKPGNCSQWGPLYDDSAPEFGRACAQCLSDDIDKYFSSVYLLFGEAFDDLFSNYGFNSLNKMRTLRSLIELNDANPLYLFVLNSLPIYLYQELDIQMKAEIMEKISKHPSKEIQMHYWLLKKKQNRTNL